MNTKPFFIVLSGLLCLLVFFNAFLVSNLDSVPIDQDYNYFIAANYYNSEESLLYSLPELEKVINYLKKGNNIFVSFVENGSTDNTKSILKDFESKLKVSNKIVFCEYPGSTTWKIGKILGEEYIKKIYKQKPLIRFQMMAGIRNAALNPLYFSPFSNNLPIKVLFLNDIFYTAHDILTLLNTNNGNFDIACGLDFYYQFYDVLVTRDLEGFWFSGFYPYVKHKESLKLLKENQAFKVLACWNGAAVFNAKGFLQHNIRFRGRNFINDCECVQSECLLVCTDFYKAGLRNIYINPEVVVSYEWKYFMLQRLPVLKSLVRFYQSFFYEFYESSSFNDFTKENNSFEGELDKNKEITQVGCSMPPFLEENNQGVYMSLNSEVCELNSTTFNIYSDINTWQALDKQYYQNFFSSFTQSCKNY